MVVYCHQVLLILAGTTFVESMEDYNKAIINSLLP